MTQTPKPELVQIQDNTQLIESDRFRMILQNIQTYVQKSQYILNLTPEQQANLSDQEIEELLKKAEPTKKYANQINQTRKDVRTVLRNNIDTKIEQFDEILNTAGYDQLDAISQQLKDLRKTLLQNRKENRWQELANTFNQSIDQANLNLREFLPNLTNFDLFRIGHDSLVTGDKNKNITDKTKQNVQEYIQVLADDLATIQNLNSPFQEQLILKYDQTNELRDVLAYENKLKDIQQAEKKAEEQRLQQALNSQSMSISQSLSQSQTTSQTSSSKTQVEQAQSQITVSPQAKANPQQPFTLTIEAYLNQKYPKTQNDNEKWNAIFDFVTHFSQDPQGKQIIKSPSDALDAIKLILTKPS